MIIDFQIDPIRAKRYDVVDAATGERIRLWIFYADDATGLIRYYVPEANGRIPRDPRTGLLVEHALHLPIRIVERRRR